MVKIWPKIGKTHEIKFPLENSLKSILQQVLVTMAAACFKSFNFFTEQVILVDDNSDFIISADIFLFRLFDPLCANYPFENLPRL